MQNLFQMNYIILYLMLIYSILLDILWQISLTNKTGQTSVQLLNNISGYLTNWKKTHWRYSGRVPAGFCHNFLRILFQSCSIMFMSGQEGGHVFSVTSLLPSNNPSPQQPVDSDCVWRYKGTTCKLWVQSKRMQYEKESATMINTNWRDKPHNINFNWYIL